MAKGSSVQRTGTATHSFDINGLYVLLSNQGIPDKYHWGLYLHCGPNGWIFHITRVADTWILDTHLSPNIINSLSMVVALKIASVDNPAVQEEMKGRINSVPLRETNRYKPLTCRTWLLQVVEELDNGGFIALRVGTNGEDLQVEAEAKASRAMRTGTQTIDRSSYSV